MDLIRLAINKPVGVTVAVLLVAMFGLIGLGAIPLQLTPTVDTPIITVTTTWPGRSPQEIVDEITKEQEEQLKNVEGLKTMTSTSSEGTSSISLEFFIDADIDRSRQEVSDALRQVPSYPEEVDEPVINVGGDDNSEAIAWILIDMSDEAYAKHGGGTPGGFEIASLFDALDKEVKPYLERVEGVSEINVFGGREREMRVMLDPIRLAQRGLNHVDVVNALRAENIDVSAGTIAEGKRDYRVRLIGEFTSEDEILQTIVAYRDGRPVYVRDLGTVELTLEKARGFVRTMGHPTIAINAIRQTGANVVEVMDELKARLIEVETDILPNLGGVTAAGPVGPDLRLRQVYDETVYIDSAIGLVTQNLWIGGAIAGVVLMLFLRSFASTGVIGLAIPISVVGTFLVMWAMGRTLNVISLAGLAFSVGMVVDNAIVVLENIYRKLQQGRPPLSAAYEGTQEVWGAVLASTLTTAAVFIPVLTIQEEAGQLFRDIAIAIVASVTLSLIVSITVIPAACTRLLRPWKDAGHSGVSRAWHHLFGIDRACSALVAGVAGLIRWSITGWRGWTVRPLVIVVMTAASLIGSLALMPPLDYLPAGNRNLVFGGLLIPPGLSVAERESIAHRIEAQVTSYAQADIAKPETVAALQPIPRFMAGPEAKPFDPVPVENYFIGAFGTAMFVGATSQDDQVVLPVGQILTNAMSSIPDSFGGARQSSLFGRGPGGGGGNTIDLEISGPDLDRVRAAAGFMFGVAAGQYGMANVTPDPANFNLQEQELRVRLNRQGRELGLTTQGLGVAIRGLFDGAFVGDYQIGGDTIDLVVMPIGGRLDYKERLATIPIATPAGRVVPIDSVVEFVPTLAAQTIQRIEELPSVTVRINPPQGMAIEEVETWLKANVIQVARDNGMVDRTMRIRLEGTAAKLDDVRKALFGGGGDPPAIARTGGWIGGAVLTGLGLLGAVYAVIRGRKRGAATVVYAATGAILLGLVLGGLVLAVGTTPTLLTARFIWALLVTYLLMCALFESFTDPLIIMFSVPLAVVGGFGGLAIVHHWSLMDPTKAPQNLDVLTMLGFVILIGVVVNNAILLVHQAHNFIRGEELDDGTRAEPMEPHAAIAESVRTRVRPIFMSVLTSVGGMLPLVLYPGAGSEMYRGLGSVVVGGLLVSTFFTLVLVPLMFSLVVDLRNGWNAMRHDQAVNTGEPGDDDTPVGSNGQTSDHHQGGSEVAPKLQPA